MPPAAKDDELGDRDDCDNASREEGASASDRETGFSIGILIGTVLGLFVLVIGVAYFGNVFTNFGVHKAAERAHEANHMKQLCMGLQNMRDLLGDAFPGPYAVDTTDRSIHKGLSYRVSLLPYLEQDQLYRRFDLTQPWDSPRNLPYSQTVLKVYHSPYQPNPGANTLFRGFVGDETPGPIFRSDGQRVPFADITDGTSNTILLVSARQEVPWAKPEELPYGAGLPLPALGQPKLEVFNVLLADGSVRTLKQGISEEVLRAMITRNGAEEIPAD